MGLRPLRRHIRKEIGKERKSLFLPQWTDGDETTEASHRQGNTGKNGNCYASLDETRTDGDETAEASHPQGNMGRNGNRYASLDEKRTDGDETATTNFIRVLVPLLQVPTEFRRM
jgi:hypothetical protein